VIGALVRLVFSILRTAALIAALVIALAIAPVFLLAVLILYLVLVIGAASIRGR